MYKVPLNIRKSIVREGQTFWRENQLSHIPEPSTPEIRTDSVSEGTGVPLTDHEKSKKWRKTQGGNRKSTHVLDDKLKVVDEMFTPFRDYRSREYPGLLLCIPRLLICSIIHAFHPFVSLKWEINMQRVFRPRCPRHLPRSSVLQCFGGSMTPTWLGLSVSPGFHDETTDYPYV